MMCPSGLLMLVAVVFAGPTSTTSSADPLVPGVRLPVAARALRTVGVPDEDVRTMLESARTAGLTAGDATLAFDEVRRAVQSHGRPANLADVFVTRIAAGDRGADLARAIDEACAAANPTAEATP